MFSLGLEALTKFTTEPVVVDSNLNTSYEELDVVAIDETSLKVSNASGKLTLVEDLDVSEIPVDNTTTSGTISVENLSTDTLGNAVGSAENAITHKSKVYTANATDMIAFLGGECEETVKMLINILGYAPPSMTITIEVNNPCVPTSSLLSVISAIEMTDCKVITNLSSAMSVVEFILGISGTEFNILPSVHMFTVIPHGVYGSTKELVDTVDMANKYYDIVWQHVIERNVLTPEEVKSILDNSDIITLTSEEIMQRMFPSVV